MALPSISEKLDRFIREHIHSVLQLEALLLLRSSGGEWTPKTLADELRITEQSADFRLKDLQLRGLISMGNSPDGYVYAPDNPELARLVDELATCYADAKYTVINIIFSQPGDSARTLAEAFRIRKRRDE